VRQRTPPGPPPPDEDAQHGGHRRRPPDRDPRSRQRPQHRDRRQQLGGGAECRVDGPLAHREAGPGQPRQRPDGERGQVGHLGERQDHRGGDVGTQRGVDARHLVPGRHHARRHECRPHTDEDEQGDAGGRETGTHSGWQVNPGEGLGAQCPERADGPDGERPGHVGAAPPPGDETEGGDGDGEGPGRDRGPGKRVDRHPARRAAQEDGREERDAERGEAHRPLLHGDPAAEGEGPPPGADRRRRRPGGVPEARCRRGRHVGHQGAEHGEQPGEDGGLGAGGDGAQPVPGEVDVHRRHGTSGRDPRRPRLAGRARTGRRPVPR